MKIKENIKTAIFCTVMPAALSFLFYRHNHIRTACCLFLCFFTIAILSLLIPPLGNKLYKTGEKAGKKLGEILSRLILFFVYIFAVIPTGLLMKAVKRDRLKLKKPDVSTYWTDNKEEQKDYEYQF